MALTPRSVQLSAYNRRKRRLEQNFSDFKAFITTPAVITTTFVMPASYEVWVATDVLTTTGQISVNKNDERTFSVPGSPADQYFSLGFVEEGEFLEITFDPALLGATASLYLKDRLGRYIKVGSHVGPV